MSWWRSIFGKGQDKPVEPTEPATDAVHAANDARRKMELLLRSKLGKATLTAHVWRARALQAESELRRRVG
jgi:hypothetical protein